MRKLLFSRQSPCLQPIRELIERQTHRTIILWTLDCAGRVLAIFERKYPDDKRPREAVEAARAWAHGEIKMPVAMKAALAAHNAATAVSFDPAAAAAARAMGHVVGTVHVETHAMGFVIYALTAFVYKAGPEGQKENADDVIAKECQWLYDRLLFWEAKDSDSFGLWAAFLVNDDRPNKEYLLRLKMEQKRVIELKF